MRPSAGNGNPSFPLEVDDARAALLAMRDDPRAVQRPVIVLGGIFDPGIAASNLAGLVMQVSDGQRVVPIAFPFKNTFDGCRRKVIVTVDRHFPSDDPVWTKEVDVIAVSMGGIVARYSAMELPTDAQADEDDPTRRRRLRIHRLFTIASPHVGANLAKLPALLNTHRSMRADSPFMATLTDALESKRYPIYPYVRLGDIMVGAENAAPPGEVAWWVPNRPFESAHGLAWSDPRILADIFRRLRGEEPWATLPRQPLPEERAE